MNKEKIYLTLTTIFVLLTLIMSGYILAKEGEINAGYALIPSLFSIVFSQLCIKEKNKTKKLNEMQMKKHKRITNIIIVTIIIFLILNLINILVIEKDDKNNNEPIIEIIPDTKKITKETIINTTEENYTIYYYGINSAIITLDNQEYDLGEAISLGKITIEEIIEELKRYDELNDGGTVIYKDGGTKKYLTDYYTLIKCHTLDGNKDIYIGNEDMEYEEIFCK